MNNSRYIIIGVLALIIIAVLISIFALGSNENTSEETPTNNEPAESATTQDEGETPENTEENNTDEPTTPQNESEVPEDTTGNETVESTTVQVPQPAPQQEQTATTATKATYTEYSQARFAAAQQEGKNIVLFFHADWCPTCHVLDQAIVNGLERVPDNTAILKIDFEERSDLKREYEIQYQHSLVFIENNTPPPYPVATGIDINELIWQVENLSSF